MKDPDEIRDRIRGPVNTLLTTFTKDGDVNHDGARASIDRSLDAGCDVIMITWGDGLVSLLTDDELAELHRTVVEHVGDRAVTIACDNMWGVEKACEFGRYVNELGFDLYHVRPGAGGLRDLQEWYPGTAESWAEYYRAVAQVMRVCPVGDLPIRACEMLEDEPNIMAFKEDVALEYAHEIQRRWGDRWPLISGGLFKRHYLLWPHGCRAWLDLFIHCCPKPAQEYWAALQRGDTAEAWRLMMRYELPLVKKGSTFRVGFDGFSHTLLEIAGVAPRWRRSPAPNATDEEVDDLRQFVLELGLL